MSGRLLVNPAAEPPPPHTHVTFALGDGRELRFIDPRRFGLVRALDEDTPPRELAALGVEPLDPDLDGATLHALARRTDRPLKTFLLDQRAVVGVGNIYASEALWQAKLSPSRRTSRLSRAQADALAAAVVDTLRRAIEHKGTTLRSYVDAHGETGWNQLTLAVYGRTGAPCPRCGAAIRAQVMQGRSTFSCAGCQR
jgi:formamidopyrimidine-DNA glycosylase